MLKEKDYSNNIVTPWPVNHQGERIGFYPDIPKSRHKTDKIAEIIGRTIFYGELVIAGVLETGNNVCKQVLNVKNKGTIDGR